MTREAMAPPPASTQRYASGLIAGESLCGLVVAAFRNAERARGHAILPAGFVNPPAAFTLGMFLFLALLLIRLPLRNAGKPEEPAPPTAIL